MHKKRVAIIFGGASSEHEISRKSATSIINNISREKYDLVYLGINKQGDWFLYEGPVEDILNGDWEKHSSKKAFITPDRDTHGIIILDNYTFKTLYIDVVIPILHGRNGEDGTMQGLLQLAHIPFVSCDTVSSASCMDKVITNIILKDVGINKAKFTWFYAYDFQKNPESCLSKVETKLKKYPVFVKPSNSGSSVGISKAHSREELVEAIKIAMREDSKILVEEAIVGQEVECAILGNNDPTASIIGEIGVPESGFYDYEDKYINNVSVLNIPANIDKDIAEMVRFEAIKAYKTMGCEVLSRVDFFVEKDTNKIFLNEINTLPGFTSISMYPKLMETIGIGFTELIDKLIEFAVERNKYSINH